MYSIIRKFFFIPVFIFCTFIGLQAQSNFTVEWESPICYGSIGIVQFERTNNIPEIVLFEGNIIKFMTEQLKI